MDRRNILILLIGSLIIVGSIYVSTQNDNVGAAQPIDKSTIDKGTLKLGSLEFQTDINNVLDQAQSEQKMIYIYGRSKSCGWCKKFEAESFTDERITNILNENFMLVSIDIVKQRSLAYNLGIRGTPTSIFTTSDGQEIPGTRIPGYMEPDPFYMHLNGLVNGDE